MRSRGPDSPRDEPGTPASEVSVLDASASWWLAVVTAIRGPSKNSDTPAAGHPRRLAPPAMLTWQSHASPSRAARGIHGCTTSGAPTILGRTLGAGELLVGDAVRAV